MLTLFRGTLAWDGEKVSGKERGKEKEKERERETGGDIENERK